MLEFTFVGIIHPDRVEFRRASFDLRDNILIPQIRLIDSLSHFTRLLRGEGRLRDVVGREISAETGSMLKVKGNMSATPKAGPTAGRTPTMRPMKFPSRR